MSENWTDGMRAPEESDLSGGEADGYHRPRLPLVSPEARALEESDNDPSPYLAADVDGRAILRRADAAQYPRPAIPPEQRGKIRVRLLNATPDPLGSIAALCEQYKGNVIRDLSEVTDEQRRAVLDDMAATVLNGPLEAAQFHWQIEGVTRSITHQMVRSRASFFAQESLRFAVPEGDWANEIPLPPYLTQAHKDVAPGAEESPVDYAYNLWDEHIRNAARTYAGLIDCGMPAEEARGILPHDMPTRIHWVMDLRTMLQEAGKRTCTQAQFPWRLIFAGMANELRRWGIRPGQITHDQWQFEEIADRLRPVCFQTGSCGFMAKFDRSCSIRHRVDRFEANGIHPSQWGTDGEWDVAGCEPGMDPGGIKPLLPIQDWEWAADPSAARS